MMTDAQTFYLLLAAFYLYECLSFAPSGSQAFAGKGGRIWRWREPAFHLSGAHKEVFCAPIIPWPGLLSVFPTNPATGPIGPLSLRHLQKRSLLLGKITAPLRELGLLLFLHYFLVFPIVYYYYLGTIWVIVAILMGELLALITACRFYCIHKRLFPEAKGERRIETFFNAFFPWHSMRASDLIVRKMTATWNPLILLASDAQHPKNTRQLARLWREAAYGNDTTGLASLLDLADIDPAPWNRPPGLDADQKFCPICRTIYEAGPTTCVDCRGVSLQGNQS